jgi:hypothetical protein
MPVGCKRHVRSEVFMAAAAAAAAAAAVFIIM